MQADFLALHFTGVAGHVTQRAKRLAKFLIVAVPKLSFGILNSCISNARVLSPWLVCRANRALSVNVLLILLLYRSSSLCPSMRNAVASAKQRCLPLLYMRRARNPYNTKICNANRTS